MAAEDWTPDFCDYDDFALSDDDWTPVPDFCEDEAQFGHLCRPERAVRRIQITPPRGAVALKSLVPGETFTFVNPINPANVYMVIQSDALDAIDDSVVNYVLLNSGRLYKSNPNRHVMQVDVRVSVDTRSGR